MIVTLAQNDFVRERHRSCLGIKLRCFAFVSKVAHLGRPVRFDAAVGQPESVKLHLVDQMDHLDDRVLPALPKTLNVVITASSELLSLLNCLFFCVCKLSYLINTLNDLFCLEDSSDSPALHDRIQCVLYAGNLLQSLQTFPCKMASEKLLYFASRVVYKLLNKDSLVIFHELKCVAHPLGQLPHEHFLLY